MHGTQSVATDAHPVAAHGGLAPDPVGLGRPVHEDPATTRVPASAETVALGRQRERRREHLVGHAVPSGTGRPQRPVRLQPIPRPGKHGFEAPAPGFQGDPGVIDEFADQGPDPAQPINLGDGRWLSRDRDRVGPEELGRGLRRDEVIMRGLTGSGAPAVVCGRPVSRVRQAERGILTEP